MYFKQLICCLSECGFETTSVSVCRASCVGIKEEFQAGRPFMLLVTGMCCGIKGKGPLVGSTQQLTLEETRGFGLTVGSQPPRRAYDGQRVVVGACGKGEEGLALPAKVRVLSLKGHSGTTCLTDRPSSSHFFPDSGVSKGTVWRWENLFFILKIVFLYFHCF